MQQTPFLDCGRSTPPARGRLALELHPGHGRNRSFFVLRQSLDHGPFRHEPLERPADQGLNKVPIRQIGAALQRIVSFAVDADGRLCLLGHEGMSDRMIFPALTSKTGVFASFLSGEYEDSTGVA